MSGVLHGVLASLKAAAAAVTDAYFKYVSLLLNTTSTNGAQNNTFLDASTNNFTITRNGNTTQGSFTPYMPHGYWGAYFDGTGDYLSVPDNVAFDFGTGDFTIEFWAIWQNISTSPMLFAKTNAAGTAGWFFQTNATTAFFGSLTSNRYTTWTVSLSNNVWTHIALTRTGSTLEIFVNGVSQTAKTVSGAELTNDGVGNVFIADWGVTTPKYPLQGYVSNYRIVKGSRVYTGNFTPSTTPLTAITNTSLLACQSNRFIDNSTNAFAITVNGDSRISKFSPFNPSASYDTATYGGSGYFDGAGDNLKAPAGSAFAYGTGDFTVEGWFNCPSLPSYFANVFAQTVSGTNYFMCALGDGVNITPAKKICFIFATAGSGTTVLSGSTEFQLNTWNHFAIVRSSGSVTCYLNGVGGTPVSCAQDFNNTTYVPTVGTYSHTQSEQFTGYLSNLRVVKGTAVYTGAFTPPTAPVTAIANTSLLLNFTNGGIYDATTINDLETSGSAQVSTTQAKFGTTSAKFAGGSDWMQMVNNPSLRFGTAPFTIEAWLYPTSTSSMCVVSVYTGSSGWTWKISGNVIAWYDNTSGNIGGTASVASNTWTHVAIVREGTGTNQFKFYVNGVLDVTSTCSANFTQTANCFVGGEGTATPNFATNVWNGYIDELRITNGYARYTSNFTPPTAAFPTQ
jgi:hypothetical protein